MNKIFLATITSFKGKHPSKSVAVEVVVKAKYKKDGIEAAREELKLWDVEHHDKYQTPKLVELEGDEAQQKYLDYMAAREKVNQLDIDSLTDEQLDGVTAGINGLNEFIDSEKATSGAIETNDDMAHFSDELRAELATVAEYPIIEPYAVRLAIAKNEESFIHSMSVVNRSTNGSMYGRLEAFNPKCFADVENAVVYGLAMAIDACNEHLVDFMDEKNLALSCKILSNYAQDAEGNFIERYIRDLDMSNATIFGNDKPVIKKSDAQTIAEAIINHPNFTTIKNGAKHYVGGTPKLVTEIWEKIELNHGVLPVTAIVEHINSMSDFSHIGDPAVNEEILSHYVTKPTAAEIDALTKPEAAEAEEDESDLVLAYAGQPYFQCVEAALSQFKGYEGVTIPSQDLNEMAMNVSSRFHEWGVTLLIDGKKYTTEATGFMDELCIICDDLSEAVLMLKSKSDVADLIINVLSCSFEDEIPCPVLIQLAKDAYNGAPGLTGIKKTLDEIQALIYSELQNENINDINRRFADYETAKNWLIELNNQFDHNQKYVSGDGVEKPAGEITTANDLNVDSQIPPQEREASSVGSVEEHSQEIAPPIIEPDDLQAEQAPMSYGALLLNSGDLPVYERVAAVVLSRYDNAHLELSQDEYQKSADNIQQAIRDLSEHGEVNESKTITALCTMNLDSGLVAINTLMQEDQVKYALEKCVVFEEAQHDEQEEQEQINEHSDHGAVTSDIDNSNDTDNDESILEDEPENATGTAPADNPPATLKAVAQLYMKALTQKLGVVGTGWGYEIKRQWETENKYKNKDCHVEVGIWIKIDGIKGEPISFFGTTQPAAGENYINDALFMALANGLETVAFSLNVNINE